MNAADRPAGRDAGRGAAGLDVARVAVPCASLDDAISCLCAQLGFRLDALWPADDPQHAVVSIEGLALELRRSADPVETTIVLPGRMVEGLRPPAGLRIEFGEPIGASLEPLDERVIVTHLDADAAWVVGRAGMRYRDLAPGRLGGRYVASHIEIPDGGPVPDYVHFHDVRFQMIACVAGWVRVVYEDQGEPFVLEPGDCVLQAPTIRHRVLEASPGLAVVEVSSPAEHVTHREHHLELPTAVRRPDRTFGGQRFVHHVRQGAATEVWRGGPLRCRDTGISAATDRLGRVRFVEPNPRAHAGDEMGWSNDDAELLLLYLVGGEATIEFGGSDEPDARLRTGSSVVIPTDTAFRLSDWTPSLHLLEIAVAGG